MIIVSGRLYVTPGQREAFLVSSRAVVIETRRAAGCRDFVVAADPIDPSSAQTFPATAWLLSGPA